MRQAAREELCGRFDVLVDVFMARPVQVNQKPYEWAKPGKNPRAVNDFGVPASIRAGWLPEVIKSAMSVPHKVGCGETVFVKSPDVAVLTSLFRRMYTSNVFAYHSDDSSLSLVCSDGMFWCNLDLSSCDTSQGPCVFQSMFLLTPDEYLRHMSLLVNQCRSVCQVGHGPKRLRFRPVKFFEYSGSVLTTLLNNVASFNVGRQILEGWKGGTRKQAHGFVTDVLERCGWRVVCEVEDDFEGIQFLKNSPCFGEDGEIRTFMNLGVILRALGQKTGDLPGKGDWVDRAKMFNRQLVKGMVHAGNHSLLAALERKFNPDVPACPVYNSNALRLLTNGSRAALRDTSVCRRYSASPAEWQELLDVVLASDVGDVIDVSLSRKCIRRDYGL